MTSKYAGHVSSLIVGIAAVTLVTAFRGWFHLTNPTIAALSYLLVVLITAATSRLWVAVVVAVVADLCLNYFFMEPLRTFAIADPQNWVALAVFLAVGVIGSDLSTTARDRTREAMARREQFLEERKRAEMARQSEELKSALLASFGHDLRTPLTAIRLAASNLQASWLNEDDRREQSDLILAEVERLNRLFENILEMARVDTGALAAEFRWVHPSEIFEAARDQLEHTLRQRQLVVVSESDVLVRLDPRLTASALAHLLENAAQYTRPEAPIAVKLSVSSDGLAIVVRDHGPGIAAVDLPHLFDRFYRGATAKQRVSGTGMGLSIARGLVAVQGGRIWAENCPEGGAEFSIFVPAEGKPAAAVEQAS